MKNNALNTLEYSGTVTLSQNIGNKKHKIAQYHNAGKYSLFSFLADCLVGDFDMARVNRPSKIMLLHQNKDGSLESLSGYIHHTRLPEKVVNADSPNTSTVRYSFQIARNLLDSLDITKLDHIGLYSDITAVEDCGTELAALVKLKDDLNHSQVSATSAVFLDWDLNISNKTEEKSNTTGEVSK